MTVLKSVAMSWQQHNTTENAKQIMNVQMELYNRINIFADHFGKVGDSKLRLKVSMIRRDRGKQRIPAEESLNSLKLLIIRRIVRI